MIIHDGPEIVEVDPEPLQHAQQGRFHHGKKMRNRSGYRHLDNRAHEPEGYLRYHATRITRLGKTANDAATILGAAPEFLCDRKAGNFRRSRQRYLVGGFGPQIIPADLSDREIDPSSVVIRQDQSDRTDERAGWTMDQQTMQRTIIILIRFALVRILRDRFECVFDAINLIAEPIDLVEERRCIRTQHVKVLIINIF